MQQAMPAMDSSSQLDDKRTPYCTPKLKRYGKIGSLTKGGVITSSTEDATFFLSIP
jgi:hypothetical protein